MSRIGKKPINVPHGVEIKLSKEAITAYGPIGEISEKLSSKVQISLSDKKLTLKCISNENSAKSMHGTQRSLINNMILGVTKGFSKELLINGVGFRANTKGKDLILNLGFSHDVFYKIPDGIKISVDKNSTIKVFGLSKSKVGNCAADIRRQYPVEPYQGKGIIIKGNFVRRKNSKKNG